MGDSDDEDGDGDAGNDDGAGDDADEGDDDDEGGDTAEVMLLNCEQRRNSGQEALNIWRTGSQPSLAASQNDAQGNTTRLRTHTHTHTHTHTQTHTQTHTV